MSQNNLYDSYNYQKYKNESDNLMSRLFKTNKFFVLNELLLKRYINALIKIFDYTKLKDFPSDITVHVDSSGFSPEIAKFLNNPNYLFLPPASYYSLIVSPDQERAKLSEISFSFLDECLNLAYKKYRDIIYFMTKENIVILQYKFNIRNLFDISKIYRLKSVTINIDTHDEKLNDIIQLKELIDNLGKDDNLLNDSYLTSILDLIKKTGGKKIRPLIETAFFDKITCSFQSFYILYPYLIISLFDSINKKILLFYDQSIDISLEPNDMVYPVVLSAKNVIENLESLKFIDYHTNLTFIDDKIQLLENLFLLDNGYDINSMSRFEIEKVKSMFVSKWPEIIEELYDLKGRLEQPRVNAKAEILKLPPTIRLTLAYAKAEFEVVNKLLCLFSHIDFVRKYFTEPWELENELLKMPLPKRYFILKYLSKEIFRGDN